MTINRIRLLPLCLLCLLLAMPARAEQPSASLDDAKYQATQAVQAFLNADPYWADWEMADLLLPTGIDGQPLDDCLVLLRFGNRYDIARFVRRDGWKFDYNNPFAIPDTELPVRLQNETKQLVAFSIQIGKEGEETWQLYFQRTEAADWALFFVDSQQPRVIVNLGEVQPTGENALYYGYEPDGSGYQWVQTPIERSLHEFSFVDFPWSPEAAMALGQPESLAELVGTTLTVAPGLRYAVYQGLGAECGRAGDGKAVVSTSGPITAYGRWRDGVLIQYAISETRNRFGWLLADDLPDSALAALDTLPFDGYELDPTTGFPYEYGVLIQPVTPTDDPAGARAPLNFTFPVGTSVHCLAAYQNFIYVEGYVNDVLRMGFVPADTVDRQHGYVTDYRFVIDRAGVYSEADIQSAMNAVAAFLHENWAGMRLLELEYRDAVNADLDAWWRTKDEDSILFYSTLDGIGFVDSEMSLHGPVSEYEWILNRAPGGDWRIVNWGYE